MSEYPIHDQEHEDDVGVIDLKSKRNLTPQSFSENFTNQMQEMSGQPARGHFTIAMRQHSGPLPSPEQLFEYEAACPGAADRIIRMAELEQEHRHTGDHAVLFEKPKLFRRGQIMALATCFAGIGGAVTMGFLGETSVAIALAAGPPIVLAAAFIGHKVIGWSIKEAPQKPGAP